MAIPVDIAIPVLASLDLGVSTTFFDALGFRTEALAEDYAIVRRDGLEIHFWRCEDPAIPNATSCYIRVSDVDTLHREWSAADLGAGRISTVEDKPWGMREFALWDPHGNLVRVGKATG